MRRSHILESYVAKMFFTFFSYSFLTTLFIWVFMDFVGLLNKFMGKDFVHIFEYYIYYIPFITVMIIPTSVMLASLFTFSSLAGSNETTAMKSAGQPTLLMIFPILRIAFLLSILVFILSEFVQPKTELHRQTLYKKQFNKRSKKIKTKYTDLWFLGIKNNVYSVKRVSPSDSSINNVKIFGFTKDDRIKHLYESKKGRQLRNGKWEFEDIVSINLDSIRDSVYTAEKDTLELVENFDDFLIEQKPPETMGFLELQKYIHKMERSGFKMEGLWADFHSKFSFPFITIIIVFLTAPLVLRHQRGGNAKNIGLGLVIIFVYYIFMKLGLALGHSGVLPPILSAWIGNIFYSCLAVFIFRKYRY